MIKTRFELLFQEAYNKLNEKQREAVDTIEGPVMVIAGPGTGKTQILSTRIANLLYQNVSDAENILCLTYTEAGALAMRKRLHELIGVTSKNVSIHTFHSFCNKVIQENPIFFNSYDEFSIADQLDEYEILDSILVKLPSSNILYKTDQNYNSILGKVLGLLHTVKKENWNTDELISSIQNHIKELEFQPQFRYKRKTGKFEKGDIKIRELKAEERNYQQTIAALQLFGEYNLQLSKNKLLDFNDLINNVIHEFTGNLDLLRTYQERYQYILVDEFQDTNGSQLEILHLLSSYWESPNLFVVGDGDQAIFRFQGANISNLTEFIRQYDPVVIELHENFRSTQQILNIAELFIKSNTERLKSNPSQKALLAKKEFSDIKPKIRIYNSILEETFDIANQIEELIVNKNVLPNKIAILYRKNNDADDYIKELAQRNIPTSQSKEINVLKHPIIDQILKIINYLHLELENPLENDYLLFELLHFPFISVSTTDIGRISIQIKNLRAGEYIEKKGDVNIRLLCSNIENLIKIGLKQPNNWFECIAVINKLIKDLKSITLENLIERILYDFKVIPFILQEWKNQESLEIINSFYEFIRALSLKYQDIDIFKLHDVLARLKKYDIKVPYVKILSDSEAVRLSTIHSAKGLEYEYVFMVKNSITRNYSPAQFKLPAGYSYKEQDHDSEDNRRLFYVGITRAQKFLQISYSNMDNKGKSLEAGINIQELLDQGEIEVEKTSLSRSSTLQAIENKLGYLVKDLKLIDDEYIVRFLQDFSLSSTSMEKYLQCPISFYYEKVLGVPSSRNIYMGFGSAVHATLERYLKSLKTAAHVDKILLTDLFKHNMNKVRDHFTKEEFVAYIELGMTNLPKLIQNNEQEWLNLKDSFFEKDFKNRDYLKVPISGKIDRIDKSVDGYRIIDYKTGKVLSSQAKEKLKTPTDKLKFGGEYWRQMIFYSLLCETEVELHGKVHEGILYYVIPDQYGEFHKHTFEITPEAQSIVGDLIVQVYSKIQNKEFEKGCGKTECRWCNLLQIDSPQNSYLEDELSEIE